LNAALDTCVIYNPVAARGRAKKRLDQVRLALGARADFQPTQGPRHAEELAFQAAQSGFAVVAAAGGDGTVHEVANGVLRADNPNVTFALYPIGSANDYAFTLQLDLNYMLNRTPGQTVRRLDVGLVKSNTGKERFFINTLGLGFSGAVTLESRKIRWLQGLLLYGLGFLKALYTHYSCPRMEICYDGQTRREPTLSLTVAIGKREGNLVVARDAVPDDGLFDYLHAGSLSRLEILRYLPRLASGGELPTDHPAIWQGRCHEVIVQSPVPLMVHLDGEFFCLPGDGIQGLAIQMLPGLLRVQS
jgi:diacylglycerol kinase (ATP)